jgi:predicted dehydrogenase
MINAAIVGLGWWGKTLVEAVQGEDQNIRFSAANTRSRSPDAREFCEKYGIEMRDSYESLINDPEIDAIVLATPASVHRDEVVAAAKAGKHVFCEKPFAMSKDEAIECIEAMKSAGRTLGLGYNRRFHPSWIDLRERMAAGELGDILHLECTMTSPNGLSFPPEAWRAQRAEAPCGGLFPMGVHGIDAMIDLCGEFDEAYCQSFRQVVPNEADDTTSVLFRMKSGPSAYLVTLMATSGSFRFQVYGSKGWALLGGTTHVAGQSSDQRRSGLFGTYIIQPLKGDAISLDVPQFDVNHAELDAFAKACEGGPDFPIPFEQMIQGVAATDAVIRSAASGKTEKVV